MYNENFMLAGAACQPWAPVSTSPAVFSTVSCRNPCRMSDEKHSGSRRAHVSLNGHIDTIDLTSKDAGTGFHPHEAIGGPGLGLTSMKERLKVVGGQVSIHSQQGRGTNKSRGRASPSPPRTRARRSITAGLFFHAKRTSRPRGQYGRRVFIDEQLAAARPLTCVTLACRGIDQQRTVRPAESGDGHMSLRQV